MPLAILTDSERRTLDACVELLRERLRERLVAVRVFGSAARGESWPQGMPIRSEAGATAGARGRDLPALPRIPPRRRAAVPHARAAGGLAVARERRPGTVDLP